jgi:DNA-binding NarL/FixJ family response regulator
MDRIKFVIAEKSYLIRKGIVSIINRIEHATVVKELDNLGEINSVITKYSPDFLVLNIDLIRELKNFRNSDIRTELYDIGIGIDTVNDSGLHNSYGLKETIHILDERDVIYKKLQTLIKEKVEKSRKLSYHTELSEREKTILKHVAKGLTNKEIADKLFLSAHTVITHRKNITNKLGIKTISGLTVYAILNNIINIGDLE